MADCRKLFSVEIRYRTFLTLVREMNVIIIHAEFTMRFISVVAGRARTSLSLSLPLLRSSLGYTRSIQYLSDKRLEIGATGSIREFDPTPKRGLKSWIHFVSREPQLGRTGALCHLVAPYVTFLFFLLAHRFPYSEDTNEEPPAFIQTHACDEETFPAFIKRFRFFSLRASELLWNDNEEE